MGKYHNQKDCVNAIKSVLEKSGRWMTTEEIVETAFVNGLTYTMCPTGYEHTHRFYSVITMMTKPKYRVFDPSIMCRKRNGHLQYTIL